MAPERKSIREAITVTEFAGKVGESRFELNGDVLSIVADLRVTATAFIDKHAAMQAFRPLVETVKVETERVTEEIIHLIYGDAKKSLYECEELVCQALHSCASMSPDAAMKVLANFGKVHRLLEGRHPVTQESSDG